MSRKSLFLFTIIVLVILLGHMISDSEWGAAPLSSPSIAHPFGTDNLGRDVWIRLSQAGVTTLVLSFLATVWSVTWGLLIGTFSGYSRKAGAFLTMRVIDVFLPIPAILIAMLLLMSFEKNYLTASLAIGIPLIPFFSRQTRSFILPVREKDFVKAAMLLGSSTAHIIRTHLLPTVRGELTALAVTTFSWALINLASLDFLGLLGDSSLITWGKMLNEGRLYLTSAPWMSVFPGLLMTLTIIAVNSISKNNLGTQYN